MEKLYTLFIRVHKLMSGGFDLRIVRMVGPGGVRGMDPMDTLIKRALELRVVDFNITIIKTYNHIICT